MKHLIHPLIAALVCSCSGNETSEQGPTHPDSVANAEMGGLQGGGSGTATPPGPSNTATGPEGTATTTESAGNTPPGPGTNTAPGGTPAEGPGPNAGTTETDTGNGATETDMGSGATETDTGNGGMETGTGGGAMDAGTGGGDMESGAGGSTTDADAGDGDTETDTTDSETDQMTPDIAVLLAGDNVNGDGPLQTIVEDLSFSGGGHILVRPTNITTEPNTKHPVVIWGPGGGTPPRDYLQLLTRMASQGFVIVGIRESTGDSVLMSAAIDWLEEQDADPNSAMHQRLILDRVGVFGHSMGGLSSEATALADSRVTTALLDNSGSFSHDALVTLTIPVGIIYGETGQERPNAEGDFENPGNQGPCWLSMMAGGGHGSGPWDGAGANVAWMRWHIGGENVRKDDFIGDGGDYNNTGVWRTQFKNWEDWKNWNE